MPASVSKENLIEDLRNTAKEHDGVLTQDDYSEKGSHSPATISRKIGWSKAMEKAGLDYNKNGGDRVSKERRVEISEEEALERLETLASEVEGNITVEDIRNSEILDNEYVFVKYFGSLNNAKDVIGLNTQEHEHKLPERVSRDEDLAYFLGVLAGDGSIVDIGNGSKKVSLCCNDEEMLEEFKRIGEEKFGIKGIVKPHGTSDNAKQVNFNSTELAKYLGDWSYSMWPRTVREDYSWVIREYPGSFLAGMFDAEGTNYRGESHQVKIYCKIKCGKSVLSDCLNLLEINHWIGKEGIGVNKSSIYDFFNYVNPRIERKKFKRVD